MNLITLNKILNVIIGAGTLIGMFSTAGQIPPRLAPYAAAFLTLALWAGKYAKTPSQSMADAVPPPKGGGVPGAPMVVLLLALGAATIPACKTTTTGPGPTSNSTINGTPVLSGVVDCALPSLFKVATFAALIPLAEHAIAQQDPIGALVSLAVQYGQAETDCVVAYLHDLGETQKAAAPNNDVVKHRVDVTAQWLAREKAGGVEQVINWGAVQ